MKDGGGESDLDTRVGRLLCERRIKSRYDLSTVGQTLHIRQSFLEAIETGQYHALPGPVYAVGFVRTYAEFLGLDGDEVVRRFRKELADLGRTRPLNFPEPLTEGSTPKGGVLLLGAIIAIAAYAGWYVLSSRDVEVASVVAPVPERLEALLGQVAEQPGNTSSSSRPASSASSPSQPFAPTSPPPAPPPAPAADLRGSSAAPLPTAEPGASGATASRIDNEASAPTASLPSATVPPSAEPTRPGPETPVPAVASQPAAQAAETPPAAVPAAQGDAPARIVLHAKADSWVEVRDPGSGAQVAARLLKAGETYPIPDRPGLRMVTGNAGGLVVVVDGQVAPSLGRDGAVRRGIPLDADILRRGLDNAHGQ